MRAQTTLDPLKLELDTIDAQRWRFGIVTIATIVVSFIHQAGALALYSGEGPAERLAVFFMTLLIDAATWQLAEYIDYAQRRKLHRSRWVYLLFFFALTISSALNATYLLVHAPDPKEVPYALTIVLVVSFALFIPGLIAVSSLARSELSDDRQRRAAAAQQGAQAEQVAAQELETLRSRCAALEEELRTTRAGGAQRIQAVAQEMEELRRQCAILQDELRSGAQADAAVTQLAQELAQVRAQAGEELRSAQAQAAQLAQELAQAGGIDRKAIAQRLREFGETGRGVAHLLGVSEATVRNWVKVVA